MGDAAEAAIAFISAGISAAAKPRLWRLRASTISIVSARRSGEGWSLSSLLSFLERVTTRAHVTVRADRFPQLLRARLQDLATDPLETFALKLATWYLEDGSGQTTLLAEYEDVHANLRDLAGETEPLGVALRRVVGASGRLQLGTGPVICSADGRGAWRCRKRPMNGPRPCSRSSIGQIRAPSRNGWP
jgi:hypothetical protein